MAQTLHAEDFVKQQTTVDSTTNAKWIDNNKTYNVFKSKSGAYYIWKTSKKTGKLYKRYLPKDAQIKLGRKYEKD